MIEDYFFTKNTKWILWGAFALVVALLIFHAGVVVGQHQPTRGMPNFMPRQGFVEDGHGAVGTIATVTLPTFILQSRDGQTQKVDAGTSTVITGGSLGTLQDLKTGQTVIILGDPETVNDQDDIDARVIHILPAQ